MYQTTSHRGRYRIFAKAASTIAAVTGVIAIIGWIVGIPAFKSLMPGSDYTGGYSTIKFNSAVCILLAGISLRLLCEEPRTAAALRISNIASAIVMLVGSLTLIEYIGGLDFGIDQLFFIEPDTPPGQFPGRMAAAAALIFITISGTLLLLGKDAKARWVEGLTFLAFFNTLVPAIGYVYGKNALYRIPYYGTISLPLTLIFLLLCATILALRPERGLMRLVTDGSSGSITARHLLPAAILLPIAIGRLEFWGYTTGMYDAAVGMIAMTLSSIVIFTLLIGGNAHLLLRLDNRRTEAEETLLQSLDVLESNMNALMQTNARLQAEISIRRATEENLFEAHEKARVTLNSIGDGVITTDIEGKVTYLNPAAERMSGWSSGEAMGQPIAEVFRIVDPVSRHPVDTALEATLHGNRITHIPSSSLLIRRDGTEAVVDDSCAPMHDRNGQVIGAVLAFHDVSAVRAMSLKMSYITQHDSLTDLPNRFLLNDRLRQAVVLAQRHGTRIALLFLDLDRFKHVNDTLSHAIGDRVLTEIAQRLKRCTHDTDTVSRHSGDEFIILLLEVADSIGIARMAAQVLKSITEPYFIDSHEIHISASIGISICPEDGEDADTLIRHAEAAMYQAKSQGRNNYQFFTRRIHERALQRFALEGNLRRAIAREESALYYQPKFNIAEGRVIGAEVLIRWHDHSNRWVPPAQFIPIAEESGLIIPIGEWVLRRACEQNRAWQDAGYTRMPIAVNVSALQFREKHFVDLVAKVLHETGLEPRYLELELTESVMMQDLELTASLLEALKCMGVGLSIDDFGTGYSSLSYLKRFPIDTLKIDRSFVQDVVTDPDDAAITCAIISMAKSLKQKVIAEGVETFEQFNFLREHGCDEIQGFYFSEPLTAQEFEHKILQRSTIPAPS